jgi:hypothetical protein
MLTGEFRPWGILSWVLERLTRRSWDMIGSIGTGNRCLSTWNMLRQKTLINNLLLFQIKDTYSPYWGDDPDDRITKRREEFLALGGNENSIYSCGILDPYEAINRILNEFINSASTNVIVDISTLPKRFFFPIIKTMLLESRFQNILVTYTRPEVYAKNELALDPEPWRDLPKFKPPYPEPKERRILVVGLGYETLGLPQLLRDDAFRGVPKTFLLPFPATPSGYIRSWESIRNLDNELVQSTHDPIRIDAYDVSAIFDCITTLTDNCRQYAIFAPYGPKTMSLAMCLYASLCESGSSVYYTQPKSYNPNYSTGIRSENGYPATYAYCVRLEGKNFYQLP